jgi:hypothetical protein
MRRPFLLAAHLGIGVKFLHVPYKGLRSRQET